jgi:glycosyltransferase involved in cell wall biosynthesis
VELTARLCSAHPRLVVAVGQLVDYKGFDVLVEAMRDVDAHLVIIGDGPRRNRLARRIAAGDLSAQVTLWGTASDMELRAVLCAADVFAFPSVLCSETFGIAQLEAMACGLPIVNTALPTGVCWVARHGHEALTVAPDNAAALADAIRRLLTDPALAERLGSAGRQRAAHCFGSSAFERRIVQVFARVWMARRGMEAETCAAQDIVAGPY